MSKIDELEWKEDKIEFYFESPSNEREIRYKNKYEEKYQSYGLGSNTYYIEKKLRKDMKKLNWKEKEKIKYKKIDLANGYEENRRWQVRMKVNSEGKLWFWIETL